MLGKICLVTGATRGLGQAAALGLARAGAEVWIVGRSPERIQETLKRIRQEAPGACVEGLRADLSARGDVNHLAQSFLARRTRLDVLINNVGATILSYQESPDGFEMTWALNYLSHFLLTHHLLGALKSAAAESGEARVVEVTSSMYRVSEASFRQLQQAGGYNGVMAYAQSKRAMIMYTRELAKRLKGSGVAINAVTPGLVRTDIAGDNGWLAGAAMRVMNLFALTPETGVKPILHLAGSPQARGVTGGYFQKFHRMPDDPTCADPEVVRSLWKLSEQMAEIST